MSVLSGICEEKIQYFVVVFEMGLNEPIKSSFSIPLFRYFNIYSGKIKESMRTQILLNSAEPF